MKKTLRQISSKLSGTDGHEDPDDIISKKRLYLPLVDIFERFGRLRKKLGMPPESRFFSFDSAWKKAWDEMDKGFDILYSHFEELLRSERPTRQETGVRDAAVTCLHFMKSSGQQDMRSLPEFPP